MDGWLKENLICPRDQNNLRLENSTLSCPRGHTYPYIDGIPIMLLQEATPTHPMCYKTLEQVITGNALHKTDVDNETSSQDAIDPYVQKIIAATCGKMYKPLINRLTRYPIPQLRLPQGSGQYFLDIGCNWGRWCISAAQKGYIPVGIDPSFDAIRAARRVARQLGVPVKYVVADARYLPFASGCFDVVFSYSVLQHFDKEDVRFSLAEIARVLKISGISMVQMPNTFGVQNLYHQLKRGFKEPTDKTSFVVRYWSPSELKNTFSNFIGSASLSVDGYFGLGVQVSDIDLLPRRYRFVVVCSEILRRMSEKMLWIKYLADSLYIKSTRAGQEV